MEEKNVKKSLFVRLFEVVIRFILHFRIPILVLIILGTLFFTYALFSLQIDANIFGFSSIAPPASMQTSSAFLQLPLQRHMLRHHQPLQRENLSIMKSLTM